MCFHFLEGLDEFIKIFRIKHDSGLVSSARFFRNLEELSVVTLFQVNIKRTLTCVNSYRVYFICVTATIIVAWSAVATCAVSSPEIPSPARSAIGSNIIHMWKKIGLPLLLCFLDHSSGSSSAISVRSMKEVQTEYLALQWISSLFPRFPTA